MSLFLRRLQPAVVRRRCLLLVSNGFSTSLRQSPPCSIFGATPCLPPEYYHKNRLGTLIIINANDPKIIRSKKKVPVDLVYNSLREIMVTIGASHGWVASLNKDDGILRLQDDLNPVASDTDPKRIPLPPLVTLPDCQTQTVTNVSMSSSSPADDEDCVVAVKFLGPQLSFCKPAGAQPREWTNIKIENPCFFSSRVMHSKKDKMFRILGSGGYLIGSWDDPFKDKKPKLQSLSFQRNPPPPPIPDDELMDPCCIISHHLVESASTGETFLVKQYKKPSKLDKGVPTMKTQFLTVFKLDDEGNAVYTQDMGGLCMFLSESEPFCVPSTYFPGLIPNNVYFLGFDETAMVHLGDAGHPFVATNLKLPAPYYIPPQYLLQD